MKVLVGYSGFVGGNIYASTDFDAVFDHRDIEKAFGINPDFLIYAGIPAEKYLANNFPEKDYEIILNAENNIKKINPKKLVLISSVDVIDDTNNFDENGTIDESKLQPYGYNRRQLEKWARENYEDCLIVRLPALFGKGIKKNFIFDLINIVPTMIKVDKMEELSKINNSILEYYTLQDNGFYKINSLDKNQKENLKKICFDVGFTALNFTDSRNKYQFYNLANLWKDIEKALNNDIRLMHLATEPISAQEVFKYVKGEEFNNEFLNTPVSYNYKTINARTYGSSDDYIYHKEEILKDIKRFINEEESK